MSYQRQVSKKSNTSTDTLIHKSLHQHPFSTQRMKDSNAQFPQQKIKNQQYEQDKFEATKLEIQAKYGTMTPEGQEQLALLQAKKAAFWQRYLGNTGFYNQDSSQMIARGIDVSPKQAIQTKLTIGAPGDKYEQEADRVAAQVVKQINAPVSGQSNQNIQREGIPEEDELMMAPQISNIQREAMLEEEEIQTKPMLQLQAGDGSTTATTELESSIQQARGSGQPLADNIRKPMEQAFGADFSGVKVHTDAQADQLNQSIQAKAFTTGQDVFFRQGEYNPGSRGGQELIAHELTHVMQQNGAAVMRSPMTQEQNQQYSASDESSQLEAIAYTQRTNLIQRKIIARIRTTRTQVGTREISEIRLEGRAPTDVPGSNQGDHTIAETLINESVKREIFGQTPQVALNNILVLATLTLPDDKAQELNQIVGTVWQGFSTLEGEDQNTIVEDVIQKYIEMANKRPGTAFLRQAEVTRGGGSEKKHISLVRDLANKLEQQQEITEKDLQDTADALTGLIDMKYAEGYEERYEDIVIRALDHALLSVLPLLGTMRNIYLRTLIYWFLRNLQKRDSIPSNGFEHLLTKVSNQYNIVF